MTIDDIKQLIAGDEHRQLELKKTTGELKDAMKSACAFLNTEGGWLIFGITPISLKLTGQKVTDATQREIAQALSGLEPAVDVRTLYVDIPDSDDNQLIVLHFDAWQEEHVPYTYQGRPYYRVESTTRVMPREMYEERLRCSNPQKFAWEVQEASGLSLTDLDEERIRAAVRLGVAGGRINASAEGDSVESLLGKFKMLQGGRLTNAAVVLFGSNTNNFPQLMLRMAYFRGKEKMVFVDNKQATGNFFDLLDAGIAFCFRHLSLSGEIRGLRREEHLEIPVEALREALTNALCHRQYDDPRASVSLAIYDDRVEIVNPGHLPSPLTPENIKEPHESYPYNLRIAQVLYLSTYLERWGTGVRRMTDLCHEQGLPEPEYVTDGHTVKIVFGKAGSNNTQTEEDREGTTQKSREKSREKSRGKSREKIISLIAQKPDITQAELANRLQLSVKAIEKQLKSLRERNIIRRIGPDNGGHWEVTNKEQILT